MERLIESLDEDPGQALSPAWRDEIQRRCRDIDEGNVELSDVADVFERARTSLG